MQPFLTKFSHISQLPLKTVSGEPFHLLETLPDTQPMKNIWLTALCTVKSQTQNPNRNQPWS